MLHTYAKGAGEFGDWGTFKVIFEYIDSQLLRLQNNLLEGLSAGITVAFMSVVTCWIMYQGFMIATGRSREPLAALITHALRLAFVSSVAVVFARVGSSLHTFTTDNLPRLAMWLVSGNLDEHPLPAHQ